MKLRSFLLISLPVILLITFSSFLHKPAYKIYTAKGEELSYEQMLQALDKADIVLFGEIHNNPISHWMELSVLKDLHQKKRKVTVGAEMFESDDQIIIDEYLQGKITIGHLSKEAKVWDNFQTDYQPLLEYANHHQLKFIATNIPRRYASLVARESLKALDSLRENARQFMAPLPIEADWNLPGYKALETGHSPHAKSSGISYLAEAQAVKDATMAHFIGEHYKKGEVFLHINGVYHSQNYEGIYWFIKKKNPSLKIVTITTVEQGRMDKLEETNKKTADYILVIPSDMTKTY